jgi:plastocyanin
MKKLIVVLVVLGLATILLAACSSGPSSSGNSTSGSSSSSSSYTVHMSDQNFEQSSITITKGSSLTLINDSGATHIIANGMWSNGMAQTMQESGMPSMNNIQVTGGSNQTVGPFATSGTFHLYCTVHPNMNLTVIVQ